MLVKNGYSATFIMSSTNNTNNVSLSTATSTSFVSAPYIKGASERISRVLKPFDIKLAHKPRNTLRKQLCHIKDKVVPLDVSGCVYKVNCSDCDQVYIGETKKNVKDRIKEHQGNVRK